MDGRAVLGAALMVLSGCNQGSAVPEQTHSPLRIAATTSITLESLLPSERMAASGPASELVFSDFASELKVINREGKLVRLEPARSEADIGALAASLRFVGLRGATVQGREVHASFESDERARAFIDSGAGGLATGPFLENPLIVDGRKVLASRDDGPAVELVPAAKHSHWQLLIGGHVDVVPVLTRQEAERLRAFPNIRVLSKQLGMSLALFFNPRTTTPATQKLVAAAPKGQLAGDHGLVALPSILYFENDRDAEAQFHRLANRLWRRTGLRPSAEAVSAREFQQRVSVGDFEVVLTPLFVERSQLYPQLRLFNVLSAETETAIALGDWSRAAIDIEPLLVMLEDIRAFAAYRSNWCGDVEIEPHSWRWIADLRRCETE